VKRGVEDTRGVVYAEFLMAFTPFFLLFLGTIQTAFIAAGSIVVQSAASKAARAAMVVLPDDPIFYDKEKINLLDFKGKSDNSQFQQGLTSALSKDGNSVPVGGNTNLTSGFPGASSQSSSSSSQGSSDGGPRLNAIRLAAYVTLAPLGPNIELLTTWVSGGFGIPGLSGLGPLADKLPSFSAHKKNPFSLRKTAIGTSALLRFAVGFGAWNAMAAAVNFPVEPWKPELRNAGKDFSGQVQYNAGDKVTVRVTYLFPCGVPLANAIVCKRLPMGSDGSGLMDELRAGVKDPSMLDVLAFAEDARFYILRAEATLPIQSAAYCYPTDKECKQ
jgi:hypothetical protein